MNYYNDNDPFVCQWVENLIAVGAIPPGDVDRRSIEEVRSVELRGYTQVHLFAGIAGWSLALELAGWPPDRPVWTVSCPCPPFSVAGRQKQCPLCQSSVLIWHPGRTGFAVCADCGNAWKTDPRHLWPEVWRLIGESRPAIVFGEQVASAAGLDWLSGVRGSLDILGYALGAADLPAAGVGAPHIRQRLFWVAYGEGYRWFEPCADVAGSTERSQPQEPEQRSWGSGATGGMGYSDRPGLEGRGVDVGQHAGQRDVGETGVFGRVDDTVRDGANAPAAKAQQGGDGEDNRIPGQTGSFGHWGRWVLVPCADGKARRVEPDIRPLADGIPARVGLLRGYGNAVVPQVAAAFVRATLTKTD